VTRHQDEQLNKKDGFKNKVSKFKRDKTGYKPSVVAKTLVLFASCFDFHMDVSQKLVHVIQVEMVINPLPDK